VIAALAVAGWYIYRRRLPLLSLLDAIAPGVLTGLAIAALGALLAGRHLGALADLPWSVALWGVRRHPVQIYEVVGFLAVALFVWRMVRVGTRSGSVALVALLGWGLVNWFVEAFRAPDVTATVLGGFRLNQVLGLVAALAALVGLRCLALRHEDQPPLVP
jgi:prolipoprotein diacylglyceryltransferase